MNRFEAQSHLLGPGNDEGAFLIRQSEKDNVGYVLSGKTRRSDDGGRRKENERRSGVSGLVRREFHFTSETEQDVWVFKRATDANRLAVGLRGQQFVGGHPADGNPRPQETQHHTFIRMNISNCL